MGLRRWYVHAGLRVLQGRLFMQIMSTTKIRAVLCGLFLLFLQSLVDAQTLKVQTDANANLEIKYSEKTLPQKIMANC
jgi:hypothetical protein